MWDSKIDRRPTGSGCAAGCAGALIGAWLGGILGIGTIYTCAAAGGGGSLVGGGLLGLLGFVQVFVILMGILGAIVGRNVSVAIVREPTALASPLSPDLDEAARARFTPASPFSATEDRIKQPDGNRVDEKDRPVGSD